MILSNPKSMSQTITDSMTEAINTTAALLASSDFVGQDTL